MDHRACMSLVNRRLNRLLTVAEAALPRDQFQAFRKFSLEEFGRHGLERDFADLFYESAGVERIGTGRK